MRYEVSYEKADGSLESVEVEAPDASTALLRAGQFIPLAGTVVFMDIQVDDSVAVTHTVRHATDEERAQTPVVRYVCETCGHKMADVRQVSEHIKADGDGGEPR